MDWQELRDYCAGKPGCEEDTPFGPDTLVFKVKGKMFALTDSKPPVEDVTASVSLKCDPDWALLLRQTYPAVIPGYYMNKKHWNTVYLDGTIPEDELLEMIDHSYKLIVQSLKKADRQELGFE